MENYENNQNQTNVNPVYNNDNQKAEQPVSMGEWLGSLCLLLIPCVNIILVFIWAFGDGKESKKNFFKAYLIYMAITCAIVFVIYIILFAVIGAAAGMYY